jgi:hypothetical protein
MKSLVSKLSENEDLTTNKSCSLRSVREKNRQKEIDRNTDTVKYPSAIFDTMAENSKKVNSIQMFRQLWYTKCFNGNSFTEEMSPVVLDMCVEYLRGLHPLTTPAPQHPPDYPQTIPAMALLFIQYLLRLY